jgi:hypothetical protein
MDFNVIKLFRKLFQRGNFNSYGIVIGIWFSRSKSPAYRLAVNCDPLRTGIRSE